MKRFCAEAEHVKARLDAFSPPLSPSTASGSGAGVPALCPGPLPHFSGPLIILSQARSTGRARPNPPAHMPSHAHARTHHQAIPSTASMHAPHIASLKVLTLSHAQRSSLSAQRKYRKGSTPRRRPDSAADPSNDQSHSSPSGVSHTSDVAACLSNFQAFLVT